MFTVGILLTLQNDIDLDDFAWPEVEFGGSKILAVLNCVVLRLSLNTEENIGVTVGISFQSNREAAVYLYKLASTGI